MPSARSFRASDALARAFKRGTLLAASRAMAFEECARAYTEANKIAWKNAKHISQRETTLRTYCYPVFGSVSVQDIDAALVLKVLEPIWSKNTETASRLRGRIEAVLDWARSFLWLLGLNGQANTAAPIVRSSSHNILDFVVQISRRESGPRVGWYWAT